MVQFPHALHQKHMPQVYSLPEQVSSQMHVVYGYKALLVSLHEFSIQTLSKRYVGYSFLNEYKQVIYLPYARLH